MNERRIKLSGTKEVKEFVNTAGLCDFDVDVFYNHFVIDAKSILGVLSLDLNLGFASLEDFCDLRKLDTDRLTEDSHNGHACYGHESDND